MGGKESIGGKADYSRNRRALFVLAYLLVLLLFFEGVARVSLAVLDKTWGPVVPPRVGRFDPMLGWALAPNVCAWSKRTGQKIEYCINAKGLRDIEAPYEKPEGEYRIALLGDSRSFGFGVQEEQHFARALEGYFKDLDVINLGVDGYGVDQELLMLRQEGFRYQPDLVMAYVAHYREERHMKTHVWGVEKPRFVLEDGELVLENQPVAQKGVYPVLLSMDRKVAAVSKLYLVLRDLAVFISENATSMDEREERRKDEMEDGEVREYQEMVNLVAEAVVLQMAEECRERGVRFMLITAIERLHDRLREAGVPVMNITGPLDNRLYKLPDGFGHFNEAGNGAFAWELGRFLVEQGLVPAGHVRGYLRAQMEGGGQGFTHPDSRKRLASSADDLEKLAGLGDLSEDEASGQD